MGESTENPKDPLQKHKPPKRQNHLILRLLVGLAFLICLAMFLHFREVRLEVLELNATADHYIIGQVDFEFPDEEMTVIIKQESVRDISYIYKFEEKEIEKQQLDFENEMMNDKQWREMLDGTTFDEMYDGLKAFGERLSKSRFTDERTFKKMEILGLSTSNYYLISSFDNKYPQRLPADFWKEVEEASLRSLQPQAADYIVHYFENQTWKLQEDEASERRLRQIVQELVPQKYTKVEAGEKLLEPGEKITPRHLAMMHAMKDSIASSRKLSEPLPIIGSIALAFIFTLLSFIYLRINQREVLNSLQKLTLLFTILILTLIIAKTSEYFLLNTQNSVINMVRYPILVPFASILICVLLNPAVAMYSAGFLSVVLSLSLAVSHERFLVINLIAALISIISARSIHKRKEVFSVCAKAWLGCVVVVIAFNMVENSILNLNLMADLITTFIFMFFTAILVVGLLPALESLFHVLTDMSLMEYMDPNSELLRRLSLEAPGTYQHSLVVGNLAENAARAIGANGLFCRVATLYHDIGKLFNPHYFTENQLGGFDIHQLLTPQESAQVIIAHIPEGETLARRYRLPQGFIDIIREHHGTTLVYFFYCKQIELMQGDASKVDEKQFRYPGPKPHSKESAIIMIADTIEAASRSLDEVTEESVSDMVDRLVSDKANDGQFDECQLTFEELGTVKKAIVKSLIVTRHLRIKYPPKQ